MSTINIIMATDARGLEPNATVLNSLRRNTPGQMNVRIFVRDLPERIIEVDRMKIEFILTPEQLRMDGNMPEHVSSRPAIDRMAAIKYCDDWDRALVLDYDQLVVGDIGELFTMDMGDALAAGRIWKMNLGDVCREWFGRRLPYIFRHCYDYRLLMFGPLMNLKAMREAGTYDKLEYFQRVANSEEQIAFHVACEDQVMGIDDSYNWVPQWDGFRNDAVIYHFTGPEKPWSSPSVEGAELWQEYALSWDELVAQNGAVE